MSLYTRALKHIDMDRVKELREEKINREQIAKLVQEQEKIHAELEHIEAEESKYINWRKELNEGMTTAGLGVIYLDGTPNVLSNEISAFDSASATVANVVSGGSVKLGVDEGQPFTNVLSGSAHTQLRRASFNFDSTRFDTFVVNITNPGGGQGEWCDPHCVFDNIVNYLVMDPDNFNNYTSGILSNGDNTINVSSNLRLKSVEVRIYQYASDGVYADGYNPPFTINSISTKRLSPISLFVALDDPEANSFLRDGTADKMSPGEKRKKLEEQLRSSEEYLNKMFGSGMPKGVTVISDIQAQQSFVDMASDARNPMGTGDQAIAAGALLASPMVQAAAAQGLAALAALVGGVGIAKQIMNAINNNYESGYEQGSELRDRQNKEKASADKALEDAIDQHGEDSEEARQARQDRNDTLTRHKRERKQKGTQKDDRGRGAEGPLDPSKGSPKDWYGLNQSYEPEGKVIKEKKSFKDITKKIPGYYDGKPSPLGFPVEEPPKMKNGFHPDLVDGKKVSQRFNRLDPISARAMPKTGNPHIDKKVRAARNEESTEMNLYTRARKHIDIDRVKELHKEKKIREEIIRQQQLIIAEIKSIDEKNKCVNWRRELEEGMTTSGMGMLNLEPGGDVDLADFDFAPEPTSGSGNSQTGNNYTFGASTTNNQGEENSSLLFDMNSEIYDTIVFDFVNSGVIDQLRVVTDGGGEGVTTYTLSASSGRKEVRLIQADRKKLVRISYRITRDAGGGLGTNKILNVAFQRRTPMNIVVALDDPRANSFIRGGLGGSEERRKQLKDMLEAGNQWMYIQGLEPSKTSPGDIALDTIPYEPPSPGPGGYKPPGSYDPNKFYDLKTDPSQLPSPNLPSTGPGRSSAPNKDTQVARIYPPDADPGDIQWPRNNPYKKPQPGPGYKPPVKKAKKQRTMVA